MLRRFSLNFALFSMCLDAILVCLSLALATQIRPSFHWLPFAADYPSIIPTPWLVYPIFALEWVMMMMLFGVYDGRRNLHLAEQFRAILKASILAIVISAGTLYLSYRDVSRLLFVAFGMTTFGGLLAWRGLVWGFFRYSGNLPGGYRQVLIIGTGPTAHQAQEQVLNHAEYGLRLAGCLVNPNSENADLKVIGEIQQAEEVILHSEIDDVILALPRSDSHGIDELIARLHRLPIKVWLIPDYFHLALHKAAIEEFAGIPLLDLRAPALTESQRMMKRGFDLVFSSLILPFTLPAMGLVAAAIRLESQGPALLTQKRAGENGRLFNMYKFRTMQIDAENLRHLVEHTDETGNLIHKTADDPRVTRLGRILRRYSLDELPQLINVVKGEMSLVGPRPELPYLVDRYETWQRQRFAAPQGMTGWWQVHGRSEKPMHLNTQDDLYYIQNYSLGLDIYILLKTIGAVIRGKGAF